MILRYASKTLNPLERSSIIVLGQESIIIACADQIGATESRRPVVGSCDVTITRWIYRHAIRFSRNTRNGPTGGRLQPLLDAIGIEFSEKDIISIGAEPATYVSVAGGIHGNG